MNTVRKNKGEINSLHVLGYALNQQICSRENKRQLNQE